MGRLQTLDRIIECMFQGGLVVMCVGLLIGVIIDTNFNTSLGGWVSGIGGGSMIAAWVMAIVCCWVVDDD